MIGVSKVTKANGEYQGWCFWLGQSIKNPDFESESKYETKDDAVNGLKSFVRQIIDQYTLCNEVLTVLDTESDEYFGVDMNVR